jgi:hypothetical protein
LEGSVRQDKARDPAGDAIRFGASSIPDPMRAIEEIQNLIWQPDIAFVIFYTSPEYDQTKLAQAFSCAFPDTAIVGCTTAGELTPSGYAEGSITAVSFSAKHFRMQSRLIANVLENGVSKCSEIATTLVDETPCPDGWNTLALLIADGMSLQEDVLVAALDAGLAPIPLFGGSAGDGMCFKETFVYRDGTFSTDAALLMLIHTDYQFREISFDHFVPSAEQMVVTKAIPAERIVIEINGEKAAEEYARIIGAPKEKLGPFLFASHPTLIKAGGRYHVRAIQSVVDESSLKFLSAIDIGIVMTIGEALDIVGEMEKEFDSLEQEMGKPALILGFDCILRKIEIVTSGKKDEISRLLAKNNVIGFSTYGEQHNGMHVNQTFVGVAFFPPGSGESA